MSRPVINLHLGDCMEAMKQMPDKAYDLAIVDPPYGINVNHNMGRRKGQKSSKHKPAVWDYEPPHKEYFDELLRVSENQIIWGANHFISLIPYNSPCWLLWDKMQEFSGAVFEMAWTSFKSPAKAFRMSRVEAYANQNKIHPTQKPVALYKWLLHNYAKEGDKILDTHGGSMSIAIACHDMGFDLDLWELDNEYYENGVKRFKQHTAQTRLEL